MKILPDYLIEYIPYIEEALEELRLSILDHAYELLKSLDIDELSTDDIRHKLELYDIKVENMTDAWLPNGRFYRMYPSIKHNRTRKNDLISIAQSGGQFEGVWSSDFNVKDKYNFKTISVARHYEMSSELDGYFYISGDTSRNKDGSIKNSAIKALQTDILMASALPAGYTYLYVPWPRPHYPDDSTYFYNVHMLDYDRLAYAEDCSEILKKSYNEKNGWSRFGYVSTNHYYKIYYNDNNHGTNKFYNTYLRKYTDNFHSGSWINDFTREGECENDIPFLDGDLPASLSYDWYTGSDTSFRTPYWFDYHFMNKLEHTSNTWPITESGKYYGIDDDDEYYEIINPTNDSLYSDAVKYVPNQKELYSQYEYDGNGKRLPFRWSVFPTACYLHARYRTSAPSRAQSFYTFNDKYAAVLTKCSDNSLKTIEALARAFRVTISEASNIIDNLPYVIDSNLSANAISVILEIFEHLIIGITVTSLKDSEMMTDFKEMLKEFYKLEDDKVDEWLVNFPDEPLVLNAPLVRDFYEEYLQLQPICNMITDIVDCTIEVYNKTIDENCTTDITNECKQEPSAYRHDLLLKDAIIIYENLHHIKTFKPVWCEETPFFAMAQSSSNSLDSSKNSLFNWVNLKQNENIINAEIYDDKYNDSKIFDTYALVVTLAKFTPTLIITAVKRAVANVLNIDPIIAGRTNISYTLIKDDSKSALEQYVEEIKTRALDIYLGYDFDKYVKFNVNALYNKASIIRDNIPAISEITHTCLDRPTIGKLDPIYVGYTMYGNNQGLDGIGNSLNSNLSPTIPDNVLYKYGAASDADYIEYDTSLYYTLVSLNEVTGTQPGDTSIGQEYYDESDNPFKSYIIGGPSTGKLYVNKNDDNTHGDQHNYATYKTSKVHRLWFSRDKKDIPLGSTYNILYNDQGSSELYYYTQNNVSFEYTILGIYNERDELVTGYDNDPTITCSLSGNKYSSFIGQVAHEIPSTVEYRTETYYETEFEYVQSYVVDTNASSQNHWEEVTVQELNNSNIHDPNYNPDNPIPVVTTGIGYYRNAGGESLNDVSVMYITYYRTSSSTEHIYILNHSGDYSSNLTSDDFGYVEIYNDDTNTLLVTSYGLTGWNNLVFDLPVGYTKVRIEFIKNSNSNDLLDRCYIAINSIGIVYMVEHQVPHTSYRIIVHPSTIEPVSASYVLATLKTFPGSVPVAPSFIVYVYNKQTGNYLDAYYIPEHNSISVDGGATYISMDDFYSQQYEFGAQGNHAINYEMPIGIGQNEDVDESVAFIDTEDIIH